MLVDTNVLLRRLEPRHPHHRDAVAATCRLLAGGEPVHVAAQNITEFWAAATRTTEQNGLGLDVTAASAAVDRIERVFALLPDDSRIYDDWRRLVLRHQTTGNRVYDARLAAIMLVHRIDRILTFNVADFARFGVATLHPAAVA